jgi:hypothetical protein
MTGFGAGRLTSVNPPFEGRRQPDRTRAGVRRRSNGTGHESWHPWRDPQAVAARSTATAADQRPRPRHRPAAGRCGRKRSRRALMGTAAADHDSGRVVVGMDPHTRSVTIEARPFRCRPSTSPTQARPRGSPPPGPATELSSSGPTARSRACHSGPECDRGPPSRRTHARSASPNSPRDGSATRARAPTADP